MRRSGNVVGTRRWLLIALLPLLACISPSESAADGIFSANVTYSIDNGEPTPLVLPSGPPSKANDYFGTGGSSEMSEDGGGGACGETTPDPSSITNWSTIYKVPWGIEVSNGWQDYTFGNPSHTATIDDILRHIEATLTTINAVYMRDAGFVIEVPHIRFLDQVSGSLDEPSYDFWEANLPTVETLIRFLPGPGIEGGASGTLCSPARLKGGHVNYEFRADPQQHDGRWRSLVKLVGHEMTHAIGVFHTDQYIPFDNSSAWVELCASEGGCYTAGRMCPLSSKQSWMGYCWFGLGACANELPRISEPFGDMSRVARQKILQATCLETVDTFTGDR